MFNKIIKFIDSLFYETKIITTVTVVRRYYKNTDPKKTSEIYKSAVNAINSKTTMSSDIKKNIPGVIRNKPSLTLQDGSVNFESFPTYRYSDIYCTMESSTGKFIFTSVDGNPVTRKTSYKGITKKTVTETILEYINYYSPNGDMMVLVKNYKNLTITINSILVRGYSVVSFRLKEAVVFRVYTDTTHCSFSNTEVIVAANAIVRAFILTACANSINSFIKDESDLVDIITEMLNTLFSK